MPGIERRLARHPQLYSRIGFLHHYQHLSTDEQTFVLSRQWPHLGLDDTDDFTAREACAAIIRITNGNFRLTTRLLAQIHRVMDINQLNTITSEVVYAVTSLSATHAQPSHIAEWLRGHWHIENRLHRVRDVTYSEDHSQIRTSTGPQVMATLRNTMIRLLRLTGHDNIAAALRHHARDHHRPLKLLMNC